MSQNPPNDSSLDPIGERLAACLRLGSPEKQAQALEEACEEHPDWAQDLRSRFRALVALGLEGIAANSEDPLPTGSPLDSPLGYDAAGVQFGDYELQEVIGQGGMGIVHRARQTSLDRDVVVKLIRPELLNFSGSRKRLRREADAIARLQHPGIVPILSAGEHDGVPYFAMEFVNGRPLDKVIAGVQGGAPDQLRVNDLAEQMPAATYVEGVLRIGAQLAIALHHAHQRGVLHRDVKPSNVLLTEQGKTCLIDFGLHSLQEHGDHAQQGEDAETAKGQTAQTATRLTEEGSAPGTLLYMAPEQLNEGVYDVRSEVYGLAATLYELLTLQPPFKGTDRTATEKLIRAGRLTPIRSHHRGVSPDVEAVLNRALAGDPVRRYVDMHAFEDDLQRLIERRPVAACPDSVTYRLRRWIGRQPALAAALLLLSIAAVAMPTAWILKQQRHNQDLTFALDREREAREGAEDLSSYVIEVLESADPNLNEPTPAIQQIMERGVTRLDARLANRPLRRAEVRRVLARIHHNLGLWDRGMELADLSLKTMREELEEQVAAGLPAEQTWIALDQVIQSRTVLAWLLETRNQPCEALQHRYQLEQEIAQLKASDAWQVLHARANWMRLAQQCPNSLPAGVPIPTQAEYAGALRAVVQALESSDRSPQSAEHGAAALGWLGTLLVQEAQAKQSTEANATFEEAKTVLERALSEYKVASMSDTLDCAKVQLALGLSRKMLGDLDGAAVAYQEAIATFERRLPPNHHMLGGALVNSAGLLEARGQRGEAIEALEQAEQIFIASLSADNPNTVVTSGNLVGTRYRAGQTDGMLPKLDDLIPRQIKTFGQMHPFVATSLEYRATLHAKAGDLTLAIEDCELSADIFAHTVGPGHARSIATQKLLVELKQRAESN